MSDWAATPKGEKVIRKWEAYIKKTKKEIDALQ